MQSFANKALAAHLGLPYHPLLRYLKKEGIKLGTNAVSGYQHKDSAPHSAQ